MGAEVERRLGIDTTLRLAIPCRASDGNELRKLSAETSVRVKKKRRKKGGDKKMKLIKTTQLVKLLSRSEKVRIPRGRRKSGRRRGGRGGCNPRWQRGEMVICGRREGAGDRDGRGLARLLGHFRRGPMGV